MMTRLSSCCISSFQQMSKKKVLTFENSLHQEYVNDLVDSNSSQKLKARSIFVILFAVLPALEVYANSTL